MNCAYDELYMPLAQRVLGDMYDYGVNTLKISIDQLEKMFLVSGLARQIEMGNPTYIAGKNGCELAKDVVETCTGVRPQLEDVMYVDKSPEYWIGWTIAYYQWHRNCKFSEIEEVLPVEEMYGMYPTLHEADISVAVDVIDERMKAKGEQNSLKRLRKYAQLTQSMLSEKSGVPIRQIQLFEQGQRDIKKTQGQTLVQLARALNCQVEDLLR